MSGLAYPTATKRIKSPRLTCRRSGLSCGCSLAIRSRSAERHDLRYDRAGCGFHAHGAGEARREILYDDARRAARDLAVGYQFARDRAHHVDGNGESHANIAAALAEDRGVHSNELPGHIDERAPGIAGIDRSIRLDEILVVLDAESRASKGADETEAGCLSQPEPIADGDVVPDPEVLGSAKGHGLQIVSRNLQHRDIGLWVGADQLGAALAAVVQRDLDFLRIFDDVVVGDDETARGRNAEYAADVSKEAGEGAFTFVYAAPVAAIWFSQPSSRVIALHIAGNANDGNGADLAACRGTNFRIAVLGRRGLGGRPSAFPVKTRSTAFVAEVAFHLVRGHGTNPFSNSRPSPLRTAGERHL
jgi:hypothetical protein